MWMTGLCIISFMISLILDYAVKNKYWSNIFIGIFASGLLALLLSIISYNVERQKALEDFYIQANKALNIFNLYENNGDIERSMDIVIEMANYDYICLDNAYGNIDFIFGNKRLRKYIYNDIYKPIIDLKNLIIEKAFHFKEYKKTVTGNLEVMKMFIDEIDHIDLDLCEEKIKDMEVIIGPRANEAEKQIVEICMKFVGGYGGYL